MVIHYPARAALPESHRRKAHDEHWPAVGDVADDASVFEILEGSSRPAQRTAESDHLWPADA